MIKQEYRKSQNLKKCKSASKSGKLSISLKLYTRGEVRDIEEHGFTVLPSHSGRHWKKIILKK